MSPSADLSETIKLGPHNVDIKYTDVVMVTRKKKKHATNKRITESLSQCELAIFHKLRKHRSEATKNIT